MYCPNCGSKNDDNNKFCSECSYSLTNNDLNDKCNNHPTTTEINNSNQNNTIWLVLAIISPILALLFLPPIIGGFGVFSGYNVYKFKKDLGIGLMIVSGVCAILGMLIGMISAGY